MAPPIPSTDSLLRHLFPPGFQTLLYGTCIQQNLVVTIHNTPAGGAGDSQWTSLKFDRKVLQQLISMARMIKFTTRALSYPPSLSL